MRRRTAWWRAAVVGAVLSTVGTLPTSGATAAAGVLVGSPTYGAGTSARGDSAFAHDDSTFAYDEDDRPVDGAATTADATALKPGETYRSSIRRNATLYYRVELDTTSTAYVPVTAVPPAEAKVAATDGIKVSVQNAAGAPCSLTSAGFGAGLSPRPVTALGMRETSRASCRAGGTYYVRVERRDATGSGSDAWGLELAPVTEPPPARTGPTKAPEVWNSASPEAVTGEPRRRDGGAGFATARTLGQGVWRTGIAPGQTLFYRVPVDWGQQLYATAELDGSSADGGYVSGALGLSVYNPVRADVDDVARSYSGRPTAAAVDPLPPVAYRNRYTVIDKVRTMRFAGGYYLVVHLNGQMADTFGQGPHGLTLRVRVSGTAQAAPGYSGRSAPRGLFEVTDQDRAAGAAGAAPDGAPGDDSGAMKALAVGGIGTGTALLVVLLVWTVTARRRASAQMRVSAQKPTA
ncbi:hypothetical protein [Streptomyces olivochromogenes]|uniref:hypothetical protein n=1 Tax=Streptomyces olivochromogenes TaxID=1963 RepID=UPI001F387A61|nr:hypothetical protein [Streptomyces olivochromogenes]MCF3129073.1 hypothetical protein [Streptomyces olivochromogenes]